eukprot:6211761-Pleurochrysis_carterae.AAC.1
MESRRQDNSNMLCACSASEKLSYLSDSENLASRKVLRESKIKPELCAPVRTSASREHLTQPVHAKLPHVLGLPKMLQPAAPLDDGDPIADAPFALL